MAVKRKTTQKTRRHISHSRKPRSLSTVSMRIRYIILPIAIFTLVFLGGVYLKASGNVHVLGASTGPLLVRDGTEGGETGGVSDSGSFMGFGSPSSAGSTNMPEAHTPLQPFVAADSQVDCVGPDGKHFTTTFHACQELNTAWHRGKFTFTTLTSGS